MKKNTVIAIIILLHLTTILAAQKSSIYTTTEGALKGFDVVAFYSDSAAIKGDKNYNYTWQNATWYFKNEENLAAFKANPEKYAPQFGGYCAYGVSGNHKAPTEAETFTIIDGKLYFNYNKKVKSYWLKDTTALILKANNLWPNLKDKE